MFQGRVTRLDARLMRARLSTGLGLRLRPHGISENGRGTLKT